MTLPDFATERRGFLRMLAAAPFAFAFGSLLLRAEEAAAAQAQLAAAAQGKSSPTPDCADDDESTPSETAGPFYRPRSPERVSLVESGMRGTRLNVEGRVFGRHCAPVAGALVDFWHCDDEGIYDNQGFRLRGHQFTDAHGRYRLSTIVPGVYPGRTRHIHVRVQPRGGRILTTQMYFPGEPRNQRDGLYKPELLMAIDTKSSPQQGRFHFVLDV